MMWIPPECPRCGGRMVLRKTVWENHGNYTSIRYVFRCVKCGYEVDHELRTHVARNKYRCYGGGNKFAAHARRYVPTEEWDL